MTYLSLSLYFCSSKPKPLFFLLESIGTFFLCCLFSGHCLALKITKGKPVIVADVHPNGHAQSKKITMKDGVFIKNGYLLRDRYGNKPNSLFNGHLGFGVIDRPLTGATYVGNNAYHEWQILTARAAGIDGFIVEWGYPTNNGSADKAIASYKRVLNTIIKHHPDQFAIVPSWIPHWYFKKDTDETVESVYESQINKMVLEFYSDKSGIFFDSKPLIFVLDFWNSKVLNHSELSVFFKNHSLSNNPNFIWRMGEVESENWNASAIPQIVGNFPWIIPRKMGAEESTNPFISQKFHYFGNHKSVKEHIDTLRHLNKKYLENIQLEVLSVSPGMDTRYADWVKKDKLLKRTENNTNTYKLSWKRVLSEDHPKADIVIIETFDDFSEATHIEPSELEGFRKIAISAKNACVLKSGNNVEPHYCHKQAIQSKFLSCQALKIYKARKLLQIVRTTEKNTEKLHSEAISKEINAWSSSVFKKRIYPSSNLSKTINKLFAETPITAKKERFDIIFATYPTKQTTLKLREQIDNLPETLFREDTYSIAAARIHLSRGPIPYDKDEKPLEISVKDNDTGSKSTVVAKIFLSKDTLEKTVLVPLNSLKEGGILNNEYSIKSPNYKSTIKQIIIESYSKTSDINNEDDRWLNLLDLDKDCIVF